MKNEITAGDRVRVLDCPNRAGQIGIAGHAYGPLRSVGFASVLISEKNARLDLEQRRFAAVACYDPSQLEAA